MGRFTQFFEGWKALGNFAELMSAVDLRYDSFRSSYTNGFCIVGGFAATHVADVYGICMVRHILRANGVFLPLHTDSLYSEGDIEAELSAVEPVTNTAWRYISEESVRSAYESRFVGNGFETESMKLRGIIRSSKIVGCDEITPDNIAKWLSTLLGIKNPFVFEEYFWICSAAVSASFRARWLLRNYFAPSVKEVFTGSPDGVRERFGFAVAEMKGIKADQNEFLEARLK